MIGKQIGQYKILERVGQGGMATVFRAYDSRTSRDVAIKMMHTGAALDDTAQERFQVEAQLVAKLEHPHLLPLYDYDAAHEPPYIVMRYLESGTLDDVLERGRLPLGEVVYMLNQICSGLSYAHRQQVVHRDIKPSNIMVDGDGNAFVTDFGIARVLTGEQRMTQTGFAVGTPGYMSPEQALGERDVDWRTDIYALGVLLHLLVTGQMPYTADTAMGLLMAHIQQPVPDPRNADVEVSDAIADVIMTAMAKDREDRYQSAGELATAFADAVQDSGEQITTTPTQMRLAARSAIQELQKWREENPDLSSTEERNLMEGPTTTEPRAQRPSDDPATTVQNAATNAGNNRRLIGIGAFVMVLVLVAVVGLVVRNNGIQTSADATATAQVIAAADDTATAIAVVPTDTHTPSDTPPPSDTPTPTATATLGVPLVNIQRNACRRWYAK